MSFKPFSTKNTRLALASWFRTWGDARNERALASKSDLSSGLVVAWSESVIVKELSQREKPVSHVLFILRNFVASYDVYKLSTVSIYTEGI